MATANVKEFTDENFDAEVLKSDQLVLVDFWAEWCPPCRALTPTIEKLADAFQGKAKIGKVNTDSSREIVMKYRIGSIPTVMLFKGGEVVQTLPGLRKEDVYRDALNSNM